MVVSLPSDSKPSSTSAIVSARLLGSTCSGLCELMIFHPVDTIAKRLMTNKEPIHGLTGFSNVVFRDAYDKPLLARYRSLFPGLGFAAGYKVSQRIYKFGGQPVVNDYMATNHAAFFRHTFGDRNAKTMMHASAGSLIGVGEIALLPLDVLKIRAQTNPAAIAGKGVGHIFKTEGFALYRGAAWTAARNAPGSFALFGGSAVAKEYIFQLEDYSNATFFQNFVSSISGASASIIVAQPLDVIKTRIQSRPFDSPEGGMTIIRNLLKTEGPSALFKGLVPKLSVVGPKLVFSFAVAQHLIAYFEKAFTF
uniref:Mitochondrial carrier n=1 Tax=Peronospora matthiolae TaxID=2874970 RepID=A0AAV1UMA9_9STRA